MYDYQRKNHIENMCVINTKYVYDSLKESGFHVKVKPVIAYWSEKHEDVSYRHTVIHMIVQFHDDPFYGNTMIDPSYDVVKHNPQYYDKICDMPNEVLEDTITFNKREIIRLFLEFHTIAEKIHSGKGPTDRLYYDAQADYVESVIRLHNGQARRRRAGLRPAGSPLSPQTVAL
jgi:tRNA nucleotidyltransferase/poly(A) polymerase